MTGIASTICTQLYIMSQVPVVRQRSFAPGAERTASPGSQAARPNGRRRRPSVMGIAASTGGPPALAKVLGALPANFPLPILLVQHMGAPFMEGFASWLDGMMPLDVRLAQDQEIPSAGRVYVAPGDRHLLLSPAGTLRVSGESAPRQPAPLGHHAVPVDRASCSAREDLASFSRAWARTGPQGLVEMRQAGGYTMAEDESTAVVYGMPAAALRMGGVNASLPLDLHRTANSETGARRRRMSAGPGRPGRRAFCWSRIRRRRRCSCAICWRRTASTCRGAPPRKPPSTA